MQIKDEIKKRRSVPICCHHAADKPTVAEKLQLDVVTFQTSTTINNNKFKETITSGITKKNHFI